VAIGAYRLVAGYTYVMPTTNAGQVCAVVYGLIGIPLAVLSAVDLGRFLSDAVLLVTKQVFTYSTTF
jgi:hypothetical protein